MLRNGGFKRYKIFRAEAGGNNIPVNYQYIATYDDHTPNDTANYIDNNQFNGVRIYCGYGFPGNDRHYRYNIVAVDNYEWESVPSDFVYILAHPITPDNPIYIEPNEPLTFSLSQNYPNPFNPSTIIKYEIPKLENVTIKIYNVLGELVRTLVNDELKEPGRYEVTFDAEGLASGVYYYTLEAGNFKETRKMVLVR